MSTPIFLAYTGSSACSASMKPAMPPIFCTSAIICRVTVVLPLDSGPYISTILPLGIPPSPRAMSRLKEPVGTVSTFIREEGSPSFITAPLPNCFSIWPMAASNAFNFSSLSIWNLLFLQEQMFYILRIKHSSAFVNYILPYFKYLKTPSKASHPPVRKFSLKHMAKPPESKNDTDIRNIRDIDSDRYILPQTAPGGNRKMPQIQKRRKNRKKKGVKTPFFRMSPC